jgi:hypothetical protein
MDLAEKTGRNMLKSRSKTTEIAVKRIKAREAKTKLF